MKNIVQILMLLAAAAWLTAGCSSDSEPDTENATIALPAGLILSAAPAGAPTTVSEIKANTQVGDEVIVRVVAGGSTESVFMHDRAVVKVVDAALDNPCLADDDHCPTPWDYCCTPNDQLLPQQATIKVVDAQNKTLGVSLKVPGRIEELKTLVVRGVVAPDSNENNLVINAHGIFVEN